jgi:hypothetical protein
MLNDQWISFPIGGVEMKKFMAQIAHSGGIKQFRQLCFLIIKNQRRPSGFFSVF